MGGCRDRWPFKPSQALRWECFAASGARPQISSPLQHDFTQAQHTGDSKRSPQRSQPLLITFTATRNDRKLETRNNNALPSRIPACSPPSQSQWPIWYPEGACRAGRCSSSSAFGCGARVWRWAFWRCCNF